MEAYIEFMGTLQNSGFWLVQDCLLLCGHVCLGCYVVCGVYCCPVWLCVEGSLGKVEKCLFSA